MQKPKKVLRFKKIFIFCDDFATDFFCSTEKNEYWMHDVEKTWSRNRFLCVQIFFENVKTFLGFYVFMSYFYILLFADHLTSLQYNVYVLKKSHIHTHIILCAVFIDCIMYCTDLYIEKNSACFYFMKIYYPMKVLNKIVL